MRRTAAFIRLWLSTDTYIAKATPAQIKRVRELCETFYEAGKKQSEAALRDARNSAVCDYLSQAKYDREKYDD